MERISIHCYKHSSKKRHSSLKNQANSILSKLNIANSPQSTIKFYIINNQCVESQKQQISPHKHALSKEISSKKAAFTANQATSKVISPHKPGQNTPPSPARKMDTNHSNLKSRGLTLSENNHSVPIGETSATKFSFSAIMTPFVTQKRGIFATIYAKTALASYLL